MPSITKKSFPQKGCLSMCGWDSRTDQESHVIGCLHKTEDGEHSE